jgi:hypothetical protein
MSWESSGQPSAAAARRALQPSTLSSIHPNEDSLERYAMGLINEDAELAPLEEHLLACPSCCQRAEFWEHYVWSIRSSLSQSWIQVIDAGG